jgi:hypothetical protein
VNRAERRATGTKQTLIMCNLVYGNLYPQLFVENHLKSLLDPTNLPALKDKYNLEFAILTDDATLMQISRHPNFMQLSAIAEIHIIKMNWPPETDQFQSRYGLLVQMFHQILPVALEKDAWMGSWVADLVFAKHALPRMLKRLEAGHDAVFNVPIRSAADSINHVLAQLPGAPTDLELFELAYRNLHHLWVASHWDSPLFSKFPYSMVWNSGSGLLAHNFGITPILFKPSEELKAVKGVIDADVPSFFKNPYWATDWTDAPVAGVEPLSNGHYPPFLQHRASKEFVADWAINGTMPCQAEYIEHPLYYPSKATFNAPALAKQALETVQTIKQRITEAK